ncbi:hypothetical protein GW933_00205 [Candidatus Falkowbacteria bacterium]|uniref:Uncharacterized protein n=1 Tax=Candidatus Buchananbacteria bacterium CG10_big_fil_rev_8_21_14_0_10_33_19 TaxID=1974525 RepID=A0A2H0W4X2_9BACT|nr:hypothetical protein [Candidatus Falkowbacteria bacterium]PIS05680.1 MAG: hypothetical protein COT80_02830 [Candidatus Buchananbacteria bacterium CG10_big_fil_rev_8_21_14_0_10_33_19]
MQNKENFLKAIDEKLKIKITFNSIEKGEITRTCVPFDFGPSQKDDAIDKSNKYHVLDLDSPEGKPHNLAVAEDKMINIEILQEKFNPDDYVTWTPNWIYPRDWGNKS